MTKRADVVLVERGLFPSRAKAREAIEAGLVQVDGKTLRKPSEDVGDDAQIVATAPYPWVSRGGLKLEAALDHFRIDPKDRVCLDIGASTGGFTDVLLSRGAAYVYAVDVGHGQLHPRITADARVISLEGTDARALTADVFAAREAPSLVVFDVSFISLRLVLPPVLQRAAQDAFCVALIKPQFEAGRDATRKGIVRDADIHARVCDDIRKLVQDCGWTVLGIIASPIEGGDGNREFLIGAQRTRT
jgi:23S rRNA (cytidine1920-2'-O)/16S rRNA (cytidine1409-2'-O)-methyltransferase